MFHSLLFFVDLITTTHTTPGKLAAALGVNFWVNHNLVVNDFASVNKTGACNFMQQ